MRVMRVFIVLNDKSPLEDFDNVVLGIRNNLEEAIALAKEYQRKHGPVRIEEWTELGLHEEHYV